MKTARLASAAGDSVGMETSSSGDVNQLWRIDPLEDGHHGLPLPLLGAPGHPGTHSQAMVLSRSPAGPAC
jgi:hypothetical protein